MKLKLPLLLACALFAAVNPLFGQGTTFTYQGSLTVAGAPANGVYDFEFRAFNALSGGGVVGNVLQLPAVPVSNGLFTVALAFNATVFDGNPRWLDIRVMTNGGGVFNLLTPRQPITATPYAILAGHVAGTIPLAQLPTSVVTNGASGINITGTFNGNGVGVTNVDLALNSSGTIRPGLGTFVLNSSPGVGDTPYSVTAADVNGDGKPDLISANNFANTLTVLTNNGSGGFTLASSPAVAGLPACVVAADVNGDGKVDLISAHASGSGTLTVLTNTGNGSFVIASSLSVGGQPNSVVAADVNGDGKLDLISANIQANTLSVLTNNGSGGFALASSPSVGNQPYAVVAADVNADGKLDLISANSLSASLTVLTNNGSGGFVLASTLTVGATTRAITAVDINDDGKIDLVSASFGNSTLSVLTNNGSGGFTLASLPSVGNQPYSVVAADVNGDGKLDLISANYTDGTLSVLINKGNGAFALGSTPAVGTAPRSVVSADVNGDGKPDLISANSGASTLSVLFNSTEFDGLFVGNGQFVTAAINNASIGSASFGSSLSQKINLFSTTFGIGIQSGVLYSRVGAGGGFGWYAGGTHSDTTFNSGGGSTLMTLTSGGLTVNGTFVSASDRNLKQDFSAINSRAILEKVALLPIQSWTYKSDPNTKHLGPMAQDFFAAFAVGPDDKHITTVDESGVALAAIQGLNQKLEEQRAENAELKLRLEKLEHLMNKKTDGGDK